MRRFAGVSHTHRRTLAVAAVGLVAVCLAALAVLRFGNPQWHRWVFMFQAYVWPRRQPEPPKGFTGVWRTWYPSGRRMNEVGFRNGREHGFERDFYPDGKRWSEGRYVNGRLEGDWTLWAPDGNRRLQSPHEKGLAHGRELRWERSGSEVHETWYFRGKEVSKEEFKRLSAQEKRGATAPASPTRQRPRRKGSGR